MKRIFAAALACAVLLAGCSAPAPSSGEPASVPASAPVSYTHLTLPTTPYV